MPVCCSTAVAFISLRREDVQLLYEAENVAIVLQDNLIQFNLRDSD